MDSGCGGGVEWPDPVAMDFPAGESPARVPRRIRERLLEARSSSPSSVDEIEAKLREADLRRQQFHEWLSCKARPKPRSPSWSSQEEDLGQRLEAKLFAAEQKRLNLLAKAQKRLARLDELRQAAKNDVEMRFEKEREELGTRVESRVRQAEANRMRLLNACMQRRAARKERTARSMVQRITHENKYKERVRSAIFRKRAAAEKKRLGLLEAEKERARDRVMQARHIAKIVYSQRETERRRMQKQIEDRLQRAKRQRAEYLRQRGSPHSSARVSLNKQGDLLSRKLARCWRRFVRSKKTTFVLAKAYEEMQLNETSVKTMPFDQLALLIESPATLQTTKALLERFEKRFILSQPVSSSAPENIDHLLKHLTSPKKRASSGKSSRTKGAVKKGARNPEASKLSRYVVRVVLCAYMILGHPSAVFSGQGEREILLMESAMDFVRGFELLLKIILDGANSASTPRQSPLDIVSDDSDQHESSAFAVCQKTFRTQLLVFDRAWCLFLYRFVAWKVKDARSLEDDLVRAACQLELSMMQKCKLTPGVQTSNLTHDMRAIQKQVTEDQKLLREKVHHLSGNAGIERMECALSDTRAKFFEAKENGSPTTPVAHISSPSQSSSSGQPSAPFLELHSGANNERSGRVVRSLFGATSSATESSTKIVDLDAQSTQTIEKQLPTENELLVNEILHQSGEPFADNLGVSMVDEMGLKSKVKETMEKAFWDGVVDSLKGDEPDYSRIMGLVKEVRDELCELSPHNWRQEIVNQIDLDILSQILGLGIHDTHYLGQILEYSLAMLQKLSAPASEDGMKKDHEKLLGELANIHQSDDKRNISFIVAIIKGLRFVLEEIQALKREVSKARVQLLEPIIRGSAGLEYLQKAFADRYGPPSNAEISLPLTVQWVSSLRNSIEEEWNDHSDSRSLLSTDNAQPLVTTLRAGTGLPTKPIPRVNASGSGELPECNGERLNKLVRLGLLHLAGGMEGLTIQSVPETFKLNALRLRSVQSQYQQIIVIATGMLVLRQVLVSENFSASPLDWEGLMSEFVKKITQLLDSTADVGIEEIVETMISASESLSETKLPSRREIMTRMLLKSLQSGDAVFTKVSRSIYLAFRAVVLGGTGTKGQKLADSALRRVSATVLGDQIVKAAEILVKMATVSEWVHGPWYRCLV